MESTAESITQSIDLSGRTALVTGATSGIGRECARILTLRGARVLVNGRDSSRTQAAAQSMNTPTAPGKAEPWVCDLSSMPAVRQATESLKTSGKLLDIVMLNAGIFSEPYKRTDDGFETTFAANYLGHFLLLHGLLERGVLATNARIVTTLTGSVHAGNFVSRLDMDMLTQPDPARFSRFSASPNSKIMLALMGLEFDRRKVGSPYAGVKLVGVSPGGVRTEGVSKTMSAWQRKFLLPLIGTLLKSVEEGAAPLLWAATQPDTTPLPAAINGARKPLAMKKGARDTAAATLLWDTSERILGLSPWPERAAPAQSSAG